MRIIKTLRRWWDSLDSASSSNLSAEAKIARATQILQDHKIHESIEFLINRYHADTGNIRLRNERVESRDTDQSSEDKVSHKVTCEFNGKTIELVIVGLTHVLFDDYDFGKLVVIVNQEPVLGLDIVKGRDEGGGRHFRPQVGQDSIHAFKNGPWVSDLRYLVAEIRKADQMQREAKHKEDLSSKAKNIDLG